ncbi:MAG: 50S ribosome-binding GTPase [Succinivibrionaceae bacterium]|nr:50S ribosome-binding GTPase [Succinivibrionaceae bacterium]
MNQVESYLLVSKQLGALRDRPPVPDLMPGSAFDAVCGSIAEKVGDFRPSLMIYGIYNSGKSTLLNALMGAELAKVADRPETDRVERYEYEGYTVYDTPGVNAPIEHEQVTMEHYRKCEMIMFVMSNDTAVEDIEVFRRIGDILRSKRPLIVVLNRKMGHGSSEQDREALEQQRHRVQENIARLGIEGAEQYYNLVVVDAKTALKGKLEHKPGLVEFSGIGELERLISDLLRNDHSKEVARGLNRQVTGLINELCSCIDGRNATPEIARLEKLQSSLTSRKRSAQLELKSMAQRALDPLAGELVREAKAGNEDLKPVVDAYIERLSGDLKSKIEEIVSDLGTDLSSYSLDALSSMGVSLDLPAQADGSKSSLEQLAGKLAGQLSNPAVEQAVSSGAEAATKAMLTFVKDVLPSLMKGKGVVWIANAAGLVGKLMGPLFTVGSVIFSAWQDSERAEEELRNQQEYLLSLASSARSTVSSILGALAPEIDRICDEIFAPSLGKLNEALSGKRGDQETLAKVKEDAQAILAMLP